MPMYIVKAIAQVLFLLCLSRHIIHILHCNSANVYC